MIRPPPSSPLFPSTPLFRSIPIACGPAVQFNPFYPAGPPPGSRACSDRKSTHLNCSHLYISYSLFFFFNDPPPTEFSPLSLHAALPIYSHCLRASGSVQPILSGGPAPGIAGLFRSEEHTSELQSPLHLLFPLFFF